MTLLELCKREKCTPQEMEKVYYFYLAMKYSPYLHELHVILKRLTEK